MNNEIIGLGFQTILGIKECFLMLPENILVYIGKLSNRSEILSHVCCSLICIKRKGEFNGLLSFVHVLDYTQSHVWLRILFLSTHTATKYDKKIVERVSTKLVINICLFYSISIPIHTNLVHFVFKISVKSMSFFATWFCYTGYWPFSLVLRSITSLNLSCINSSFVEKRPLLPLSILEFYLQLSLSWVIEENRFL